MNRGIQVNAIKISYNNSEFYLASLKVKEIFKMTAVTRAEEDPENGYQRTLGSNRVKKIAQYLNEGNMIPGTLILSSTDEKPDFDEETKTLTLNTKKSGLLVIDGQHRLYGAYQSEVDVEIPACIFFGLDRSTEVQYFLDVNGYQLGVPKTLRLELEKFTAEENSEEYVLKSLFDELDNNINSPLSGKMARTKSVSGKISHVSFQNGIKPILKKSPFNTFSLDQKKKVLINFFQALEDVLIQQFGDNKKISNSAFFQAIMTAFTDVCHVTNSNFGDYKRVSFGDTLQALTRINWDLHTGTNKSAIKNMEDEIIAAVATKTKIRDELF